MNLIKTKLQNGMMMWYDKRDNFIGKRIALRKYEEYESELILRNVNKDSVVVDIGANIGYYTLLLAKVCKKVYAIEPENETFEILRKNVEENKLTNVVLIKAAVGDKNEMTKLYKSVLNNGDHKMWTSRENAYFENISCRKLDDLVALEQQIDLIKIDVQGWEPQVIAGAKNIIEKYSPVLFLEFNGDYNMIKFLKKYYKNIFTIDYWFYVLRTGIIIDKITGYADLLLTNKNTNWWERYRNWQWKKWIKKILRK